MTDKQEDYLESGHRLGGKKAAAKNLASDPDFYRKLGKSGGSTKTTKLKGWAYIAANNPERMKQLSSKGGRVSRRAKRDAA